MLMTEWFWRLGDLFAKQSKGFSSHYTCLTSEDTKGYPLPPGIKDSIPAWIKFSVQAPGEIPHKGIYYDPPEEVFYAI